ncbi:CAMK family protein kinase [Histomonas meleagridis]|uniref:CAMK family protein kinase n=1 Tax=Histomonas meleagridis TaxID=135588 RepID=UPI003559A2B8|nr:CAMK family protein kinase [Histomonas meleagridis]KAH0796303.1 CAMK family protein kinase [Histomonas meleagridis]
MGTCSSSTAKVRKSGDKSETEKTELELQQDTELITSEFSIANEQVFNSINSTDSGGISAVPSFFNPEIKPTIFEYEFIRHVGHGATSDVFLVKNTETGEFYAAKVYDRGYLFRTSIGDAEQPIQKLLREAQIMSSVQHENCLSLIEILEDDVTNSITLIIPFADAGSLSKYSYKADPLPEDAAKSIFYQIASGLQRLHSMNIIHRDLKPDNILKFSDGHVAIADFSVSIVLEDENELLEDTDGTPAFYSPEECLGGPYLGKPTDVWAYGMILYVMIYGKLPFFDLDDENIFFSQFFEISQRIINDEFTYPQTTPISAELRDLFSHVLDKDPKTRYTIEQVLAHQWFDDVRVVKDNSISVGDCK